MSGEIISINATSEFLGWLCPIKVTCRRVSVPGIRPIFKLTFQGLLLWLNKAIPEILSCCNWFYAPLLRLYHENYEKNLQELQFVNTGSNEPSHAHKFELPDNTFKPKKVLNIECNPKSNRLLKFTCKLMPPHHFTTVYSVAPLSPVFNRYNFRYSLCLVWVGGSLLYRIHLTRFKQKNFTNATLEKSA